MTQYSRGTRFEYRVRDKLLEDGWTVVRSAGSHTPIDIVSFRNGEVLIIQCKLHGALTKGERVALLDIARENDLVPMLAHSVNHRIVMEEIRE